MRKIKNAMRLAAYYGFDPYNSHPVQAHYYQHISRFVK